MWPISDAFNTGVHNFTVSLLVNELDTTQFYSRIKVEKVIKLSYGGVIKHVATCKALNITFFIGVLGQ